MSDLLNYTKPNDTSSLRIDLEYKNKILTGYPEYLTFKLIFIFYFLSFKFGLKEKSSSINLGWSIQRTLLYIIRKNVDIEWVIIYSAKLTHKLRLTQHQRAIQ